MITQGEFLLIKINFSQYIFFKKYGDRIGEFVFLILALEGFKTIKKCCQVFMSFALQE